MAGKKPIKAIRFGIWLCKNVVMRPCAVRGTYQVVIKKGRKKIHTANGVAVNDLYKYFSKHIDHAF